MNKYHAVIKGPNCKICKIRRMSLDMMEFVRGQESLSDEFIEGEFSDYMNLVESLYDDFGRYLSAQMMKPPLKDEFRNVFLF